MVMMSNLIVERGIHDDGDMQNSRNPEKKERASSTPGTIVHTLHELGWTIFYPLQILSLP
jgi:hypothetical protein